MAAEIIAALIALGAGLLAQTLYLAFALGESRQRLKNIEEQVKWLETRVESLVDRRDRG